MIGYERDTESMTKDEAARFIMWHCQDCEIWDKCNKKNEEKCNEKIQKLIKKLKKEREDM